MITAMEFGDSTEMIFKDQENPRSKISYRKLSCALLIAVVFCLLLLVVCIVLAAVYSHELSKARSSTNTETKPRTSTNTETKNSTSNITEKCEKPTSKTTERCEKCEKNEICDDEQCFHLGLELVKSMNKSVDPCEDFYAYACGGWQRRHPLKNNETESTTGNDLWDAEFLLAMALISAYTNYSKNDAVMKTVRVYKSCLNTTAIDALGLQPLNDLIKEYGGWSISQNYDPKVTVAQRIGRAARELNVDSLFGMDVQPNDYNNDVNVLVLKESRLGLNKGDYLNLDANSKKKRKNYKNYVKFVSQVFKVSYAKMEAIYDFEVELAKIVSGKSSEDALTDHIRKIARQTRTGRGNTDDGTIKLSELCLRTGFPWPVLKEVLDFLFARQLTGHEKIQYYSDDIDFLKAISLLYNKINHALIADYIMWQVVRKYVGALPNQYRSSTQMDLLAFTSWYREYQCIDAMLKPFDMPLTLLYLDAVNFNDDAKVEIKDMTENIRTSLIQKLQTQTWMDKATREMAKEKAMAITIQDIGYPAYIKDPAKLKAQYDSLTVTDSLMDNLKAANHFYRMRTLNKFQRPVDKKEWTPESGFPWEDNAFYEPQRNKITFLAGHLQKPMYSPDYPRYINYGYMGYTIGHEITHAFDATGRLFDKNGNYEDWWSSQSAQNFESKSECFVIQYNNYKIFNKHENGKKTLNDNIADNGGIKLAYNAYQRWTKENGTEKILPGLDLNPNQLFFLRFAQSWCSVYNKKGAYDQLKTDEHSTGKYRVIGPLSNFRKFSEVFKCPLNSGMNPVDKCDLW